MTYGMTWYQPKEQDHYGPGLIRIVKNMSLKYYTLNPTDAIEGGNAGVGDDTNPCLDSVLET
jgi:hypothetical protein